MSRREKVRALEALYAELPEIECKGLCHDSCGPITFTRLEGERMARAAGKGKRAEGVGSVDSETWVCPLLTEDGRCSVYPVRPLLCRLYGVAEGLVCPHGCKPSALLVREHANRIADEVRRVGGDEITTAVGKLKGLMELQAMANQEKDTP